MQEGLDSQNDRCAEYSRQIALFEAKDKARSQLISNVNDQRMRGIIEKHVLRPLLGHSQFETLMADVDESQRISKSFLSSYISIYVQEQKKKENGLANGARKQEINGEETKYEDVKGEK